MGDYEQDAPWSTDSLKGCKRFIDRIIRLKDKVIPKDNYSADLEVLINKSIKKVEYDLLHMAYNTAVSTLMILVNAYDEKETITKADYEVLLTLLNPVAPHITEELNEELGNKPICESSWPKYDENKTIDLEKTIGVQVNGKIRASITINIDDSEDLVKEKAMKEPNIIKFTEGKEIVKIIVVKGKIVNIVVK
jgi:leucyl-tRNA synthetase